MRYLKQFFTRPFQLYIQKRAHHWTATITLFSFIELFPLALFATSIIQMIPRRKLEEILVLWMPDQVLQVVLNILYEARRPPVWEIIFSLIVFFWGFTHIIHSFIEISDEFYNHHKRRFWHRRALAFVILVIVVIWQVVTLGFYTFAGWIKQEILSFGIHIQSDFLKFFLHWSSNLFFMALQALTLTFVYAITSPKFRIRGSIPGALTATVSNWALAKVLAVYLRSVPIRDIYGALTNIIVFLLWVYWMTTFFILSVGVNKTFQDIKYGKE